MQPPRIIPDNLRNAYTLDGQIPVYDWYLNDSVGSRVIRWDNNYIQSFIDRFTFENVLNDMCGGETYAGAAKLHVQACQKYVDSIKNKDVAVIGSQSPWIEAILVNAGAKSVTTVEYNVPVCNHPIIKTVSYDDFCKSSVKYDSIFSFSSIEHSGLGRYGDPLNPNGDIMTMEEIYRCLVDGGVCFVGFPVGKDHLVWNVHRIYGEKRLKLMYLDKFIELEWFGCNKDYIHTCPVPVGNPTFIQPIIVLQKPKIQNESITT
jgi:hypothetical protein